MSGIILRSLARFGKEVAIRSENQVKHMKYLGAATSNGTVLWEQRRWRPVCTVDTNVEPGKIDPNFLSGLSSLLAETLNKPEKLISVVLRTDVRVYRNGNEGGSASVQIWSIGVFDEERNPGYSKIFIDYLSAKLGLPSDRITLFFHPVTKTEAGHLLYMDQ